MRGAERLFLVWGDGRIVVRSLRAAWPSHIMPTAVMAFAIAATSALLSIAYVTFLLPLPYPDAGRLVTFEGFDATRGWLQAMSTPVQDAIGERRDLFREVSGAICGGATVVHGYRIRGTAVVSPNWFRMLGARPIVGRGFEDEDALRDVAVLSEELWRRHYATDLKLLGQTIEYSQRRFRIIGVMAGDSGVPCPSVDIWTPLSSAASSRLGQNALRIYARLKANVPFTAASVAARASIGVLLERSGYSDLRLIGAQERSSAALRPFLRIAGLLGASVLLLASLNVAAFALAKTAARWADLKVRAALGASRPDLWRPILVEQSIHAGCAGLLGVALAIACAPVFLSAAPIAVPRLQELTSARVLLVCALPTVLGIALLTAAVPATYVSLSWRTLRLCPSIATPVTPRRVYWLLAGLQTAVATTVAVPAIGLAHTVTHLASVDLGFEPRSVLVVRVAPRGSSSLDSWIRWSREHATGELQADNLRHVDGVLSIAGITDLPTESTAVFRYSIPDAHTPTTEGLTHFITPGYFATMGIPILRGGIFSRQDTPRARSIAVINLTMAKTCFGGVQEAIGAHLQGTFGPLEVLGVVADVRHRGPHARSEPEVYLLNAGFSLPMTYVVRTSVPPVSAAARVRAALERDGHTAVLAIEPMSAVIRRFLQKPIWYSILAATLAVIVLCTATVGTAAAATQALSSRVRELGIRVALGATPLSLVNLFAKEARVVVMCAMVLGLACGSFVWERVSQNVEHVVPLRIGDVATVICCVLAATAMSAFLPLRRALTLEPSQVLRHE
jgi:predicted permease